MWLGVAGTPLVRRLFFLGITLGTSLLWAGMTPRFTRIPLDSGLSQSTIQALVQDRSGFIWAATQDGLNRYDGYSVRVFRPIESDGNSLSDNFIRTLLVDSQGRLWVGTRGGGLNLYHQKLENFSHYRIGNDDTIDQLDIIALFQDSRGMLWVGTLGGLYHIQADQVGLSTTLSPQPQSDPLFRAKISSIYGDDRGNLWVGCQDGRLYQRGEQGFVSVDLRASQPGRINAMTTDTQGTLWVAADQGLFSIPRDEHYLHPQSGFSRAELGAEVLSLFHDREGQLWGGTNGKGLFCFSPSNPGLPVWNRTRLADDASLSDNRVHCLFADRTGALWVGTGGGICRTDLSSAFFEVYTNQVEDPDSLSHNLIVSVVEDERDGLWVGTRFGGLNRTHRQNPGVFEHFRNDPRRPDSLAHDNVRALAVDPQGFLWVGTEGGGLDCMNLDAPGLFHHFPASPNLPNGLSHDTVRHLIIDRNGYLWVATYGGGINRLAPEDTLAGRANFLHLRHDPKERNSLSHDVVRVVTEDSQEPGRVFWVGTQGGGLSRISLADGTGLIDAEHPVRFHNYSYHKGSDLGPGHNVITDVCMGVSGQVWIGTPDGLNLYDGGLGRFMVFREGLPNNVIYAIKRDESNFLWLATNKGLARFDPWTHTVKAYDRFDGFPGNEFNAGASYTSKIDGKLYFGGMDGLVSFYGDRVKSNTTAPQIALTELLLFNKAVKPGLAYLGGNSNEQRAAPLLESITTTTRIVLHHDDTITLKFAGLHFANPTRNAYAYMLEGLNTQWIHTDANNRSATYTNLAPGSYAFRVKASNKDGVWSESERHLELVILPPYWRTWWAYAAYVLLLFGIITLFIRNHHQQLDHERSLVDTLKQVDRLKDEFLANTSHELRTPLNGMIGLAESLLEVSSDQMSAETRNSLTMIVLSGRRLAALVNDILDFSKLRNRNLELNVQALDLHALVDVVLSLTRPLLRDKALRLLNKVQTDLPLVYADENRLQQILHNLVGNAVKFTEHGSVTVSARLEGERVHVAITDTGIGIAREHLDHIFESFVQADGATARQFGGTGLGLAITRQLVGLHGGEVRVSSTPGQGSTFSFDLEAAQQVVAETSISNRTVAEVVALVERGTGELSLPPAPERTLSDADVAPHWHLLIVDDEAVNRLVLHNHLIQQQFKLTEATNGAEALAALEADPSIDLVLLDIMMPRLSGYEVCRYVRRTRPANELPIIFLSARNQVKDLAAGFHAGGNDYISKPFSREELMVRLAHHLALLEANRLLEARRTELAQVNRALVEAQQQLVINEKMVSLGMLTAGVSHEINNPASYAHGSMQNLEVELGAFRDYLFQIAGDDVEPEIMTSFEQRLEPIFKHARLAREGTSRIRGIVMDLNHFARAERGMMERVPLIEGIRTTLNLVKANFLESVHFECLFEDALEVLCRPAELNQVFMNLIVNACQAIQSRVGTHPEVKGQLTIATRVEGDEGVILFKDNGCGIDAHDQARIFEPFYTTKPKGQGTGQGLAISKTIIENHHGRIEVHSTTDVGTEFKIRLPLFPVDPA